MLEVGYYATDAGRSQPIQLLATIPAKDQAAILADLQAVALYGSKAPVSMKPIKGHRPMFEIRTGGFRTFYVVMASRLWILHVCKKQDQERGIEAASKRMKLLQGGG